VVGAFEVLQVGETHLNSYLRFGSVGLLGVNDGDITHPERGMLHILSQTFGLRHTLLKFISPSVHTKSFELFVV
jgi:hypothetical protein